MKVDGLSGHNSGLCGRGTRVANSAEAWQAWLEYHNAQGSDVQLLKVAIQMRNALAVSSEDLHKKMNDQVVSGTIKDKHAQQQKRQHAKGQNIEPGGKGGRRA